MYDLHFMKSYMGVGKKTGMHQNIKHDCLQGARFGVIKRNAGPGWVAPLGGVLSRAPKGFWFNPRSGRVWEPIDISLSHRRFSLSLKSIKHILGEDSKKRNNEMPCLLLGQVLKEHPPSHHLLASTVRRVNSSTVKTLKVSKFVLSACFSAILFPSFVSVSIILTFVPFLEGFSLVGGWA